MNRFLPVHQAWTLPDLLPWSLEDDSCHLEPALVNSFCVLGASSGGVNPEYLFHNQPAIFL